MKIVCDLDGNSVTKEVYKVQIALFGGPSALMYNEDKTQTYETNNRQEVKAIRDFIGKGNVKVYVMGHLNNNGQIVMEKVIPKKVSDRYNW